VSSLFALTGELDVVLASPASRRLLFDRSTSGDVAIREATAAIIDLVRGRGDAGLRELARRFDGVTLQSLEVPREELQAALKRMPGPLVRAMRRAAANIERAHSAFLPAESQVETEPGVVVSRRPSPLDRIGVYAPGGRAAYPSSVLMGAIPARVAGVREIVLCSPPGEDGLPAGSVLAAAALAEVDRVFAIGGAGAVAAMAAGTESVPRVDKIVGPGNAYVAEAKLQLSGSVAFDSPAGPSELLVLADETASPDVIARELLAQAEHDPLACVVLLATARSVCDRVHGVIEQQLSTQPRREIMREALRVRGGMLWSASLEAIFDFSARYAPEHLLLALRDAPSMVGRVRNAGTVFVGECSSVTFGDYMTGANHVLPTGTLARSYSGLSTLDFVRWTTFQQVSRDAARALAEEAGVFATAEGLYAHAAAARAWGGEGVKQ
jgi:histidinol dehydrogenase